MQKVIGLDIGSYSVKAVEIVNSFKSHEISNYYSNVIPNIDEVSQDIIIPTCLEQLFSENQIQADRIMAAMPGQYVSTRILPFYFSDPHKIQQSLIAMVEDQVPFHLDDMIVDHQILGTKGNQTMVLVVMTRKSFLGSFLDHLQRINIDPKIVDVDSLAFYNLAPYLDSEQGRCISLVDVGHEKTSVCIIEGGVLRMFRSINLGGRYISEFLSRDMETSFNQAQRIKHDVSRVLFSEDRGSSLSQEERHIAERTTIACNGIIKEIGRTFHAFKSWNEVPIEHIYLSGGTSRLGMFPEFVGEHLETNSSRCKYSDTSLLYQDHMNDDFPEMSQGISIGLRAIGNVKQHSQINLRRGSYAYVQDYESVLQRATTIAKVFSIAIILLCLSYTVQYAIYSSKIEVVQNQYRNELVSTFPDMKKKHRPHNFSFDRLKKDGENRFRERIQSKKAAVEGFLQDNSDSGAFRVLQKISEKIPKELLVDVTLFRYETRPDGSGFIRLKAETDSYATQAEIITALQSIKLLEEVEEKSSGAKIGSSGNIIEFVVQGVYKGQDHDAVEGV
ncbi:MAG: pilus assembly protein PilM [Oligoflexales bacterium]